MSSVSEPRAVVADGERGEPAVGPRRFAGGLTRLRAGKRLTALRVAGAGPRAEGSQATSVPDARVNRFVVNVASSLGYVVLNTALMVWYVPFLLGHLGLAAYGMVTLVNALFMYSIVLTDSLTGATFRYLAIDLNRGDAPAALRTFNNALALAVLGCGVLLLPIAILTFVLPTLFEIPEEMVGATRFLLLSTFLMAFTSLVGGTFGASSLVTHRFDLRNIVRALTQLSRVGVVAICFVIWPANLWHVAAGMIAAALVSFVGDILLWRSLTPQLVIRPALVRVSQFRPLIGISGWSAVNTVGLLLLMQVDLLIVNSLFGLEMTGRYGSILLLPTLIYTLMEAVIPILSPSIMASYARNDAAGLRLLTTRSVKLLALVAALPAGLLCGLGRPLLSIWLGPDFADLHIILVFLVGHLAMTLATRPLSYVLTAHNKVRLQGLVTLAVGAANIPLAMALALYSGLGPAGVAAAGAIAWTLRSVVFVAIYSALLVGLRWFALLAPLMMGLGLTAAVAAAGQASLSLWPVSDWLSLAITGSAIGLVYCGLAYALVLSPDERRLVGAMFGRRASP